MVQLELYATIFLIVAAVLSIFRGLYYIVTSEISVQIDPRLLPPSLIPTRRKRQKSSLLDRILEKFALAKAIDAQLERAHVQVSVREWVIIWMAIVLVAALLGWLISGSLLGMIMMGATGFIAPRFWLNRRIDQRHQKFNDQLTDVLRMLISSLQAGHGILQAIQTVAQELPPPAGEEFDRVVREVSLGYSMEEALARLCDRMNSDDLELIVTAINIQSEVGGKLSDILQNISDTIADRVRLKGEIAVMTSQQRTSGYVISGMPFILAVIISVINPGYLMELFQPGWRWLPALAVGMMVVGQIVMQRMMKVEV